MTNPNQPTPYWRPYTEERLRRNAESRAHAVNDRQPFTEYDDEMIQTLYVPHSATSDQDLTDIAEMLGRTRESIRERFYKFRRADEVTYTTTTSIQSLSRKETTTHEVTRRPKWMDEEDLPDWYV